MMAEHFKGMLYSKCLVFLDDVVVFGKTTSECLTRYREFCALVRSARLKLKPEKCELFQKEVAFLGHRVSKSGVGTDPEKVAAVQDWRIPRSRREVRSFLGLVNYYRRYIPGCSTLAKPMTELTSPKAKFTWTGECQKAFESLKAKLSEAPILGFPREDAGQFLLDSDASDYGLGAVLSQVQDDQEVVISYASRMLSPAEMNYCVTRRELLRIIHAVKVFKRWLILRPFLVRTDHE